MKAKRRRMPWETVAFHSGGERYWIRSWGKLACRLTQTHKDRRVVRGVSCGEPLYGLQCLRCWRSAA